MEIKLKTSSPDERLSKIESHIFKSFLKDHLLLQTSQFIALLRKKLSHQQKSLFRLGTRIILGEIVKRKSADLDDIFLNFSGIPLKFCNSFYYQKEK